MSKKYHIITFGCQMNEHDSERMAGLLRAEGYLPVDGPEAADVVLVNTCSVRQKAEHKAYSQLGRLGEIKAGRGGDMIIGVCGCMAQSQREKLHKALPFVDLVLGTHKINHLLQLLRQLEQTRLPQVEVLDEAATPAATPDNLPRNDPYRAWVTIMEGCNNFCTYCIVPYVRGRERSRPIADIVREVEGLAASGYKEVTLLGQNVNSYGIPPSQYPPHPDPLPQGRGSSRQGADFVWLLERLNQIEGLARIRFVTNHPKDLSPGLITAMATLDKVCEQIHLPVQAGSDRILRIMNRGYTQAEYLAKIKALREQIPHISITTDIMVGFPGETEEDFEQTLHVVREARFDSLFSFIYGDRPNTVASKLEPKIPKKVALPRFDRLIALQQQISAENQAQAVGQRVEVLVECPSQKNPAKFTGRTRTNKLVHFEGSADLIGSLIHVQIIRAAKNCYIGKLDG